MVVVIAIFREELVLVSLKSVKPSVPLLEEDGILTLALHQQRATVWWPPIATAASTELVVAGAVWATLVLEFVMTPTRLAMP
jgi:hypothetical protein